MSRSTFILIPSHFGKNLKMFDFKKKKLFIPYFNFNYKNITFFNLFSIFKILYRKNEKNSLFLYEILKTKNKVIR